MSIVPFKALSKTTSFRACALAASVAAISLACAAPASANSLDLGTAGDYAVVDTGGSTFGWNVPVTGDMLLGNGVTANFAGGASITGRIYYDSTTLGQSTFTQVAGCNPASNCSTQVSTSVTNAAITSADNVANYAAGLTANDTFTNINFCDDFFRRRRTDRGRRCQHSERGDNDLGRRERHLRNKCFRTVYDQRQHDPERRRDCLGYFVEFHRNWRSHRVSDVRRELQREVLSVRNLSGNQRW